MKELSIVMPIYFLGLLPSLTLGLKVIFDKVKSPADIILTNCRP